VTPDFKWFDVIKATGPQALALAIACGLFLFVVHVLNLPLEGFTLAIFLIDLLVFLISSCWAVISAFVYLINFIDLAGKIQKWRRDRQFQSAVRSYLPYMTDKEKEIITYLLAHNRKTFTAAADFGYAATLASRGIVKMVVVPGAEFDPEQMTVIVPDVVWKVLEEHKDNFVYEGEKNRPHPWRVPWQLR